MTWFHVGQRVVLGGSSQRCGLVSKVEVTSDGEEDYEVTLRPSTTPPTRVWCRRAELAEDKSGLHLGAFG